MTGTYLTKRNGTFYFRIAVPKDLRSKIGKGEIHRSLHTQDRKIAKGLCQTMRAVVDYQFAMARQKMLLDLIGPASGDQAAGMINVLGDGNGLTSGPRLTQAIEEFVKDRRALWTPKTVVMHTASLRLFVQVVGDRPIGEISRKECRKFKETLLLLPPNFSQRFKGRPIKEVIAMDLAPMSHRSVNKNLGVVANFFNWLVREDYIKESPAKGLILPIHRAADTEREVFSNADLFAVFGSPLYRGCASRQRRTEPGPHIIKDHRYWLPLIALYSGMRLEEIAQLRTEDIRQVDGVWVFDVNAADNKRLKTPQSKRLVPIHSQLIKLGLLDHGRETKQAGSIRLWSELTRSSDGFYSSKFSKWFGRFKKQMGVTNPKVTFHSFRHTFINQLKQAGAPESIIKELVGHKDDSITFGRYGKRYQAQVLAETMSQVTYPIDHERTISHES